MLEPKEKAIDELLKRRKFGVSDDQIVAEIDSFKLDPSLSELSSEILRETVFAVHPSWSSLSTVHGDAIDDREYVREIKKDSAWDSLMKGDAYKFWIDNPEYHRQRILQNSASVGLVTIDKFIPSRSFQTIKLQNRIESQRHWNPESLPFWPKDRFYNHICCRALGTGFLLDEKRFMLAGHMLERENPATGRIEVLEQNDLERVRIAFGIDDLQTPVGNEHIYRINKILKKRTKPDDYAIVELNRTVEFNAPKYQLADCNVNDRLYILGHPLGLQLVFAPGGEVLDDWGLKIRTNLDAFSCNSGSPIFNYKHELVGMLTNGVIDFIKHKVNTKTYLKTRICNPINCKTGEQGIKLSQIKTT